MDHLRSLQLFSKIVETGSFSGAADLLDIPHATATHAIKRLETRLGARLLERSTRHVQPSLDGQAFYERCLHVLAELEDAEASLRHVSSSPRGSLRLDIHGTHATHIVLPRIDEFRNQYPRIDLVISTGDRLVDLIREGIDCVIRAGQSHDPALVTRLLADMPQVVCASPAYLKKFGIPHAPTDLVDHQVVRFVANNGVVDYSLELAVDGEMRRYELGGWLAVSDAESYVVGALRGCGLIQLPRFHVAEALTDGRLIEVLAQWESPALQISAMYPRRRQLSSRVRVFIDWVSRLYGDQFAALAPAAAGERPRKR